MNADRFLPFLEKLKSKWNFVMVILGIVFLLDLYTGSAITKQIVLFQCRLMNIDPFANGFKIVSVFGRFTSVAAMAKVLDKALFIGFFVLAGGSYCYGLVGSLLNK